MDKSCLSHLGQETATRLRDLAPYERDEIDTRIEAAVKAVHHGKAELQRAVRLNRQRSSKFLQSQRSKAEQLQRRKLQNLVDAYNEGEARIQEARTLDYDGRYSKVVAEFDDVIAFADKIERKN